MPTMVIQPIATITQNVFYELLCLVTRIIGLTFRDDQSLNRDPRISLQDVLIVLYVRLCEIPLFLAMHFDGSNDKEKSEYEKCSHWQTRSAVANICTI